MALPDGAVPVRPGEHACGRFARREDRRRLAESFVRSGLARGHKVVYLCDREDVARFVAQLAERDDMVAPALERGQLEVQVARDTYMPDGRFDVERMLQTCHDRHARALGDGWPALSVTEEMNWSLDGATRMDDLGDYERRLDEVASAPTLELLCQYDHSRFPAGTLSALAEIHPVDIAPELAAIGRAGHLGAAVTGPERTLRLTGDLDFTAADVLAGVLGAHFHGALRVDLSDVEFVDAAGLRALRGRTGQPLTIAGGSDKVLRLSRLLAWDTDPGVEFVDRA